MSDEVSRIPDADSQCWLFDYKLGWVSIPDPLRWPEETTDFGEVMRLNGYYSHYARSLGREFDYVVHVREADRKAETPAPYPYLVEYGDDAPYFIFVNNLPSMVELLSKLSTIAHAALLSSVAEDVRGRLEEEAESSERKDRRTQERLKRIAAEKQG